MLFLYLGAVECGATITVPLQRAERFDSNSNSVMTESSHSCYGISVVQKLLSQWRGPLSSHEWCGSSVDDKAHTRLLLELLLRSSLTSGTPLPPLELNFGGVQAPNSLISSIQTPVPQRLHCPTSPITLYVTHERGREETEK